MTSYFFAMDIFGRFNGAVQNSCGSQKARTSAAKAATILPRLRRSESYGLQRFVRCHTDFSGPRKTLHSTSVFAEPQEKKRVLTDLKSGDLSRKTVADDE
jgi:hypothetical protein